MKTTLHQRYDAFYYDFDIWYTRQWRNARAWLAARRMKRDPVFDEAYKKTIFPYWSQFNIKPRKYWFQNQYMLTKSLDPRCIPRGIWFSDIIPHFNKPFYERQLSDKNLHNLTLPGVKRPETLFKCMDGAYYNDDLSPITWEEALARCGQKGQYIVKPTKDSFEGFDIHCFDSETDREAVKKLLDGYGKQDYIVQKFVSQHPDLAALNPSSVNTVRFITVVLNGKAHILSSILRVGAAGNKVDNVAQGGYQCTIRPDGTLEKLAFTHINGQGTYTEQTASGVRFEGFSVPAWDALRQTALDLAVKLPFLKLIGWDLAVDEQGDVVAIEFNAQPEQNESTCGPSFGDLTDDVLAEVFKKTSDAFSFD